MQEIIWKNVIAEQIIDFTTFHCINGKNTKEIQKFIQPTYSFLGPKGTKT